MGVDRTIDRAVDYLIDACSPDGWWRDFDTLAGSSDEWVTAYVGSLLAAVSDQRLQETTVKAWSLLRRRRFLSPGWGYNARVPADIDTTIWVLRLGYALGVEHRKLTRARRWLLASQARNGGFPTYPRDGAIRRFTGLVTDLSFRGWCSPQVCVSAAAAGILGEDTRPSLIAYLRKTQYPDGSWPCYWWYDREYAVALAVDALVFYPQDRDRIQRAAAWMRTRLSEDGAVRTDLHPDGSPFATALAIQILARVHDSDGDDCLVAATTWLRAAQRHDGSWLPSAELRIPAPNITAPDMQRNWTRHGRGAGSILNDQRRIFTTATAVKALSLRTASSSFRLRHEHAA